MEKHVRYPELRRVLIKLVGERTQEWIAGQCGVRQPAVNDWINGYDRPRLGNLILLAHCCDADPYTIAEAAGYSEEAVRKISEHIVSSEMGLRNLLEFFVYEPGLVQEIVDRTDPKLAADHAIVKVNQLKKVLAAISEPETRLPLLSIQSQLSFVLATASWASGETKDAPKNLLSAVTEQREIAEETGRAEPATRALMLGGYAYYASGNYSEAWQWFTKAVEQDLKGDRALWAEVHRNIALASARLGDVKGFRRAEDEVKRYLDSDLVRSFDIARHLEGLGRGQAVLGIPHAIETIGRGWKSLSESEKGGNKYISVRLELMRSQTEALLLTQGADRRYIESIANQGVSVAQDHGYSKYRAQFEHFLRDLESQQRAASKRRKA